MYITGNECFLFACLLSKHFPVAEKVKRERESQSASIIVVENLTVKLYPWDEEMWQRPMTVSEFKVYGL